MNIQIIGKGWENKSGFKGITLSPLSLPRSLDEFDINIIDLNTEELWRCKNQSYSTIDDINHLQSIFQMVKNRSKANIVYVFPRNYLFLYHEYSKGYYKSILLKDELDNVKKNILCQVVYQKSGKDNYYLSIMQQQIKEFVDKISTRLLHLMVRKHACTSISWEQIQPMAKNVTI